MEDTSKANIVFNISGGNNQILPNAIKAEQNFYGDKYIEEMMKAKTTSQEPVLSPETTRLSLYINNVLFKQNIMMVWTKKIHQSNIFAVETLSIWM